MCPCTPVGRGVRACAGPSQGLGSEDRHERWDYSHEECNKARMAFKVAHKKDLELIIGGAFRLSPSPETIVLRRHYKFIINTSKLNFELDESEKLANMFFTNLTSFGTFTEGNMINVPSRILIDGHDTSVT